MGENHRSAGVPPAKKLIQTVISSSGIPARQNASGMPCTLTEAAESRPVPAGETPALRDDPPALQGKTPVVQPEGPRGWHFRGYLPHFDGGQIPQMVTFRLADSFPTARLDAWRQELGFLPTAALNAKLRRRIEEHLDLGYGECCLKLPEIAAQVQSSLLFFDGRRYDLVAWSVMPNHVHVLFVPRPGHTLTAITHSWKSFTAKEANRRLHRSGHFWAEDYFDRFIRDENHLAAAIAYIEQNPVKAGLCSQPVDWAYGSAHHRSAGVPPAS
jgi:REP element-mobilizing transposase RayT